MKVVERQKKGDKERKGRGRGGGSRLLYEYYLSWLRNIYLFLLSSLFVPLLPLWSHVTECMSFSMHSAFGNIKSINLITADY